MNRKIAGRKTAVSYRAIGAIGAAAIAGGLASAPAAWAGPVCPLSFTFTDFDDVDNLSLVGDAAQGPGGVLRLTPNDSGQAGAAWYWQTGSVRDGFETFFRFRLDGQADGFAFVIHLDPRGDAAIGDSGSGMGYGWNGGEGIVRSVAIEFDTFSFPDEFPSDHVSVQTNGAGENETWDGASLGHAVLPFSITDGEEHTVRIGYLPGALYIYVDGAIFPTLVVNIDLNDVNGDAIPDHDGCAWIGFTAGTGAASADQDILEWEFNDGEPDCLPTHLYSFQPTWQVLAGWDIQIEAGVVGTGPITYEWKFNGQVLEDSGRVTGATTDRILIYNATTADMGLYEFRASNQCSGVSTGVNITVFCSTDWNIDGSVNSGDVTRFLSDWFGDLANGTTLTDIDGNPGVNSGDVTTFLSRWFADLGGC